MKFPPELLSKLNVPITRLVTDSRAVTLGDTFVAYPGENTDGRRFIAQAIAQGANAVLWESQHFVWNKDWQVPNLAVSDLRHQAGWLADAVYGQPSEKLWVVGVTGTNGKTSTSHWIASALGDAGRKCALIGTLGNGFPGALQASANTTPDAIRVHGLFAEYLNDGARAVAMEVSSHALAQGRVNGVRFDVALLTNLSHDHLDYHGDMESYAASKRKLFDWETLKCVVLNLDDGYGAELAEELCGGQAEVVGYGMSDLALQLAERLGIRMVYGNLLAMSGRGLQLEVHSSWGAVATRYCEAADCGSNRLAPPPASDTCAHRVGGAARLDSALVGRFNAENLLGALAVLLASGVSLDEAVQSLGKVQSVAGRMQRVGGARQPTVIVDYAHTPDALEKVLLALREVSAAEGGKLICVFGCGGDRDRGKRPMMGRVAEKFADRCIVTSDNPRGEDPQSIIEEVLGGMDAANHDVVAERAVAIARAIGSASRRDTVLIAGKGHEDYQEIAGVKHPFSDVEVAAGAGTVGGTGMMLLSQAAKILDARMVGADVRFAAVSTDSRKIKPGDLFVALRGEKFDGYEFAASAVQAGAVAVLVNADSYEARPSIPDPESSILLVADTRLALGRLAAHWRRQFDIPLAAITGSNGKTTVKEMLAGILRMTVGSDDAVLATAGNFNNDIGMPLTLLQLNARHRYAVIEMGMNHPGEIDYLSRIACPDIALITNAGRAHLEGLGSVEAVARAKGEIFAGLGAGGTAIINADDACAPLWRGLAGTHPLLEFGANRSADVHGQGQPHGKRALSKTKRSFELAANGQQLTVQTPIGRFTANLQVPGAHNAYNALAAAAAAITLNVPLETVVAGLEKFGGVAGRLQRKAARHGATLIDDTYNANPASVRAAIAVLAQASGKRVLVLGDMGELGDGAAGFHAEIGIEARSAGIEKLYAMGALSANAVRAFGCGAEHFERIEDLLKALEDELDDDTTVLVKGSRFMKMERVIQACVAQEGTCCSN